MESIHGEASLHGASFRETPPRAANQRERILSLLRDAARSGQGVSGDALYYEHKLRQAPTKIFEFKNHYGYQIKTLQDPDTRLATYFLRGDPPEGWCPPAKQARFPLKADAEPTRQHGKAGPGDGFTQATGKLRPAVEPEPLFLWESRQ